MAGVTRPTDHRPVRHLQRRLHGRDGGAARRVDPRLDLLARRSPGCTSTRRNDRDFSNARDYDEFCESTAISSSEKLRRHHPRPRDRRPRRPVPYSNSGQGQRAHRLPRRRDPRPHRPGLGLYIGRHVIWKEPLAVRNRTMQKNLSHKTIVDDAANGGLASADELLIFRKPGGQTEPIAHPSGLTATTPATSRSRPSCTGSAAGTATRRPTGTRTGSGDATPRACGTTSASTGCCRSGTRRTRTTRSTSTRCNST